MNEQQAQVAGAQEEAPLVQEAQREASNGTADGAPMDYTIVEEEDSMDDSQGTQDLQVTLEEARNVRMNLESKFEDSVELKRPTRSLFEESGESKPPTTSIREKIAHFEMKASQNKIEEDAKKPPCTIVTTKEAHTADRLKVYLRVRPCSGKEDSTIEILENSGGTSLPNTIRTHPPVASNAAKTDRHPNGDTHSVKEYGFTSVLGPGTSQSSVFELTAAPLVNGLCRGNSIGKSALLFCYGITNAGKTHTVLGDPRKQESWGLIPRTLSTVMQKVQHTDMEVCLSSFEIYNEHVIDLLPSEKDKHQPFAPHGNSLKIREGHHGRMVIPGLAEYKVDSVKTGLSLIRRAKEARHTAPNHLNRSSSRSHSITQITVRRRKLNNAQQENEQQIVEEAHLWIVDLAGNERAKRTNAGALRQREATFINKSLMNLMRCLTQTQKPYRDSKLTLLFMHHWCNPSNTTTMIVNAHGAPADYDETQHVLQYAISSKSVPVVASKAHASKQSKAPEYDYDGRRKAGKQLTMVEKAAKMIRKLSPKRVMPARKRKMPAPAGQESQRRRMPCC